MTDAMAEKMGGNGPIECDETFCGRKGQEHAQESANEGPELLRWQWQDNRYGDAGTRWTRSRRSDPYRWGAESASRNAVWQTLFHEVINHVEGYVREHVHTNGIENFWSLPQAWTGIYISVEPAHLDAYVVEQVYRYDNRKGMNDSGRFSKVLSQGAGKGLTCAELTGKDAGTAVS